MKIRNYFFLIGFIGFIFLLTPLIVLGSDATFPQVKVYSADGQRTGVNFFAFDKKFRGGGDIAVCNLDKEGKEEIVVGAGPGGGPQVRAFDSRGNFTGFSIFPFHPNFRGGVDVACGDVDGDKKDEIIVSQQSQGQAWVKVYKADFRKIVIADFLAYPANFQGGARVASGDINGDGIDEIVTASGIGSPGHIRVFNGQGKFLGWDTFPFGKEHKGGADVAIGNVDGGKESEIIVSILKFGQPRVKVYKTDPSKRVLGDFLAYSDRLREGVNVTSGDIDQDGEDEVITGANGGGPHLRAFEAWGQPKALSLFVYPSDFRGGIKVASGQLNNDDSIEIVTFPGRRVIEGRTDLYKYIEVRINQQKLYAYEGGKKVNEFLVSTGIYKYPTPIGDFKIWAKLLKTRMKQEYGPNNPDNYDLPNVPHVMYFYGGYALHGTYWHHNFGHRMSHGCVNLSLPDAAWLYGWAFVGDPVLIRP